MAARRFFQFLALIVCISSPDVVWARDYYFFNKPGVDRQTYLPDRITCERLTGGARFAGPDMTVANQQIWQNRNLTTGQAAIASGMASLLVGFMAAREQRNLSLQVERICLADKGYKRLAMDSAAFREIDRIKDQDVRIDQWFALASGVQPGAKEMPE